MANAFPTTARCLGCRYALRGLPTPVCPECGRNFDPHDPSTYADASKPPRWWHWARPPSNVHILLCAGATFFLLNDFSLPGNGLSSFGGLGCIVLLAAPLVGLALIIDFGVRLFFSRRARARAGRDETPVYRGAAWRWCVLPTCLAIILGAAATDWALRLRFHLSRPAFERVVQSLSSGAKSQPGARWVGLYYIHSINRDSGGDVGFMTGPPMFDVVGFQHGTGQGPVFDRVVSSRPLAQNWYLVEWDW